MAAVSVAVLAAACAVALISTGRLSGLSVLLAFTSVAYLAVVLVGAAVVRARPRSRTGWVFLVSGTATPVSAALGGLADAATDPVVAGWLLVAETPFAVLGVPLMATYGILYFPDRRAGTRGRRVLAGVYAVELLALLVWGTFGTNVNDLPVDNPVGVPAADGLVLAILVLGPLSLFACVSLWRDARRMDGPWAPAVRSAARVAFVVPAAYLACVVAGMTTGDTAVIGALEDGAAITLAAAAWVGVIRYGLLDARAVLNRALVYGILSVALVAVYLAVVVALGVFAAGLVPQIVAAGAAALAVLPLREIAQRRINQLVYGLRDDPAAAFARLGDRLDAAGTPEDMLPAAARTVAEALRLPYVAIEVGGETLARHGRRLPGPVTALALPFAGETIGQLVVQSRDGDLSTDLTPAQRGLLEDLTIQVAVAARAVALTQALRASRQKLVAAREEERRRLRRDLHDGLGPTLAGIGLGLDTVRRAGGHDAATTDLLATLRDATEGAVDDIRRIVYDLRPPILDELGLAGALREQAARLGAADVRVPETLPVLPAAVEVAMYRIAVEALTNAARHAPGSPVRLSLSVNGTVRLSVSDGGAGLPDGYRAGVGLTSMRERAAELGGQCVVTRSPSGTQVLAELPLDGEA